MLGVLWSLLGLGLVFRGSWLECGGWRGGFYFYLLIFIVVEMVFVFIEGLLRVWRRLGCRCCGDRWRLGVRGVAAMFFDLGFCIS